MNSPLGRIQNCDPPTYQHLLADLIRVERPSIVVETGVFQGLGSEYILKALDDNGKGHLYSIDPMDKNHLTNGCGAFPDFYDDHPIVHPRFTLIRELSFIALPELFDEVGEFDLFIHDSDHSWECQNFEFESAWNMVRSGGIIASDDCFWGDPPHLAWDTFKELHGITDAKIAGTMQYFRKPNGEVSDGGTLTSELKPKREPAIR
jgi:predicted O-methyltransferase YrrM